MHNISQLESLRIWEELILAREGMNSFGGDTAEIYAYRLMPPSPRGTYERDHLEQRNAAISLVGLCSIFEQENSSVSVTINKKPLAEWLEWVGSDFNHRAHVKIVRS